MKKVLGVYLPPQAVAENPAYAQRIVECGVNLFVLRTGFDPRSPDPALTQAVEVSRALGVGVGLLVGTWWGGGVSAASPQYGKSFESRFPTDDPGGLADVQIRQNIEDFCTSLAPDAICLTHARYRHPAYIEGMFELGGQFAQAQMRAFGLDPTDISELLPRLADNVRASSQAKLWELSADGLETFVGRLTDPQLVRRWFDFRCEQIFQSVSAFASVSHRHGVQLGTNAFSPIAARLCGQDYHRLGRVLDEIQPLLGYMEWHTLESICAWARFLLQNNSSLREQDALALTKRLFCLDGVSLPGSLSQIDRMGEGEQQHILSVTQRELALTARYLEDGVPLAPVLRGKTWPRKATDILVEEAASHPFRGLIFQGCSYLASPVPAPIWD